MSATRADAWPRMARPQASRIGSLRPLAEEDRAYPFDGGRITLSTT